MPQWIGPIRNEMAINYPGSSVLVAIIHLGNDTKPAKMVGLLIYSTFKIILGQKFWWKEPNKEELKIKLQTSPYIFKLEV